MNTASSAGKAPAWYSPHTPLTHTYAGMHMELSSPSELSNQFQVCVSARHDTTISVCVCKCISKWHKNP